MSVSVPVARSFLNTRLTGDATLLAMGSPPLGDPGPRIHPDNVPQNPDGSSKVPFPAVVYAVLSPGIPQKVVGNITIWSELVFLVTVNDKTRDSGHLTPIANRIDALLDGASGPVASGEVVFCVSDAEFYDKRPTDGGGFEVRIGRQWRITATA